MRAVLGNLFVAVAAAFTAYILSVMTRRIGRVVLKDSYRKILKYELVVCAVFLALALDFRFGFLTASRFALIQIAGWTLRCALIGAAAQVLIVCAKVIVGGTKRSRGRAKHAIVLGLALENGRPAEDLVRRVNTAADYLKKNRDARLILTGGNADGSEKTEADVMRELLADRGVSDAQMVLEDRAETTKENFLNTARMIDPEEPVALISSDYHMDRAVRIAKEAGFRNVLRVPAPSSVMQFGANVLWEVVLEIRKTITGK